MKTVSQTQAAAIIAASYMDAEILATKKEFYGFHCIGTADLTIQRKGMLIHPYTRKLTDDISHIYPDVAVLLIMLQLEGQQFTIKGSPNQSLNGKYKILRPDFF